MRGRSGVAACAAAVAVAMAVLSGCGGDGDGGGGDGSPTPTQTPRTPSPSPTDRSPSPSPTQTGRALVQLRDVGDLGMVLTDAEGRTLYLFEADTSEESTCYDACAVAWPPLLTSGTPRAGDQVQNDLLGVTERRDGTSQVTYDGHPLYYYETDDEPGEAEGQGIDQFGGLWWAVDASGNAVRDGQDGQGGQDQDGQDGQDGQDQDGQDGQEEDGGTTGGY